MDEPAPPVQDLVENVDDLFESFQLLPSPRRVHYARSVRTFRNLPLLQYPEKSVLKAYVEEDYHYSPYYRLFISFSYFQFNLSDLNNIITSFRRESVNNTGMHPPGGLFVIDGSLSNINTFIDNFDFDGFHQQIQLLFVAHSSPSHVYPAQVCLFTMADKLVRPKVRRLPFDRLPPNSHAVAAASDSEAGTSHAQPAISYESPSSSSSSYDSDDLPMDE